MKSTRQKIGSLLLFVISVVISSGCQLGKMKFSEEGPGKESTLQASGIFTEKGSRLRCDVIYPNMYEKSKNIFGSMVASYNETYGELPPGASPITYGSLDFSDGKNANILKLMNQSVVTNPLARKILINTYQMLLNITRNAKRPVDPVGFYAVVKDFESSDTLNSWGKNGFNFHTMNCSDAYLRPIPCWGYFQVALDIEPTWKSYGKLHGICGKNGLNILGMEGGPDFCASQFWWTKGGARKCQQMNSSGLNPCIDPSYTWTPNTFAYAWRDAYIQANQWSDEAYWTKEYPGPYGIHDSWKKMYTGLRFNGMDHLGYEHCAVQYYLKTYRGVSKDWQMPLNYDPSRYIRSAVRRFLYEIGVTPVWGDPEWTPELARAGKDYPYLKKSVPVE